MAKKKLTTEERLNQIEDALVMVAQMGTTVTTPKPGTALAAIFDRVEAADAKKKK